MDYETLIQQSRHNAAIEAEEMNLVSLLRPRVFMDGDQWCVLYGEDLMNGVAGFGDSPILAVYDFNKAWRKEINHDRALNQQSAAVDESPPPIYYMRDNHTFKRLSENVSTALAEIEGEFNAGYTYGTLCSERNGFECVHASGDKGRMEFLADCKAALTAALAAQHQEPKP